MDELNVKRLFEKLDRIIELLTLSCSMGAGKIDCPHPDVVINSQGVVTCSDCNTVLKKWYGLAKG